MQIYSSPELGLDLTHSAGSRMRGGCLPVWVRTGCCILKIDSHPFLGNRCHLISCPGCPGERRWDHPHMLSALTRPPDWTESDLLYPCGCVNKCYIEAIQWCLSQLYQVSITVILGDHTAHPSSRRHSEECRMCSYTHGFIIILILLRYV